jgi:uncharacterized repeat protein (TIGR02543 family)
VDDVSSASTILTMPAADIQVTAEFRVNQYTVTFRDHDGSEIKTETVNHGDSATAPVEPTRTGYTFTGWDTAFDNVTSDLTVTAQYVPIEYTLTVNSGSGSGSYVAGTQVNIEAYDPPANQVFSGWTGDIQSVADVNSASTTVSMPTRDISVSATYTEKEYTVEVAANPQKGGVVSGGGVYDFGAAVLVEALPDESYTFANWSENGQAVSAEPEFTFIVTKNRSLTANFSLDQSEYEITLQADPGQSGDVSGGGKYYHGTDVEISANAEKGWVFEGWFENGLKVSSDAVYRFEAKRNMILTASFRKVSLAGPLLLLIDEEDE